MHSTLHGGKPTFCRMAHEQGKGKCLQNTPTSPTTTPANRHRRTVKYYHYHVCRARKCDQGNESVLISTDGSAHLVSFWPNVRNPPSPISWSLTIRRAAACSGFVVSPSSSPRCPSVRFCAAKHPRTWPSGANIGWYIPVKAGMWALSSTPDL